MSTNRRKMSNKENEEMTPEQEAAKAKLEKAERAVADAKKALSRSRTGLTKSQILFKPDRSDTGGVKRQDRQLLASAKNQKTAIAATEKVAKAALIVARQQFLTTMFKSKKPSKSKSKLNSASNRGNRKL